ncbi:hypothetical protein [Pedobacter sp.]|uniref:hypothetical protein n=1 Tax=Pedobacter sp. TaxID=1411316 RepID=UPI003BAC4B4F
MHFIPLKDRQYTSEDMKLKKVYDQFGALLMELEKKALPADICSKINERIQIINNSTLSGTPLIKLINQVQKETLKQLEQQLKIVPERYYQGMWMLLGMSGIGLPIGVAFGLSIGNIGLLGTGLPIGMLIGLMIGIAMDKKALQEGRQLAIRISC